MLLGYGLGIKCNNDEVLQSGKSDQGELVNYEATFHSEACEIIHKDRFCILFFVIVIVQELGSSSCIVTV